MAGPALPALEQQLKTIRAAVACENTDRSDEALVSVGWSLRRPAGPAATMPAPVRLTAQANGYTGELSARWTAVPNKKFYEVQATPLDGSASAAVADDLPTLPVSRSKIDLKGFVPGSLVGIRVRAVGAKGVGPWCDPITARV